MVHILVITHLITNLLLSSWDIQVAFSTIPLTAPDNLMADVTPKWIKLVMSALTLCDCNAHSSAILHKIIFLHFFQKKN